MSEKMGSLWADYRIAGRLKLGLGARYIGANDGISDTASVKVSAYTLIDAMLGFELVAWDFRLNVRNRTDREYFASCGYGSCCYGDQRRINATLSYRW